VFWGNVVMCYERRNVKMDNRIANTTPRRLKYFIIPSKINLSV
jgi:hypothetical protein